MAVTLKLDNNELALLYFYLQLDEKCQKDPAMEKLGIKMESLVFSHFSIDEIENFRKKMKDRLFQEDDA